LREHCELFVSGQNFTLACLIRSVRYFFPKLRSTNASEPASVCVDFSEDLICQLCVVAGLGFEGNSKRPIPLCGSEVRSLFADVGAYGLAIGD